MQGFAECQPRLAMKNVKRWGKFVNMESLKKLNLFIACQIVKCLEMQLVSRDFGVYAVTFRGSSYDARTCQELELSES